MCAERLLLDQGNSRLKWQCENQLYVGEVQELPTPKTPNNKAYWTSSRPPDSAQRQLLLQQLTQSGWRTQQVKVSDGLLGLRLAYADSSQLGVDRWLAMLAAWKRFAGACVLISAGSALTVDIIDNTGQHLGGAIAPGLGRMRADLQHMSSLLNSQDEMGFNAPGSSTSECVAAGCYWACLGLVHEALRRAPETSKLVLSGGDAHILQKALSAPHCIGKQYEKWVLADRLVLHGMAIYAQQHG